MRGAATAYAPRPRRLESDRLALDLALCALDGQCSRIRASPVKTMTTRLEKIFTRIEARPFLARLDRAVAAARKAG